MKQNKRDFIKTFLAAAAAPFAAKAAPEEKSPELTFENVNSIDGPYGPFANTSGFIGVTGELHPCSGIIILNT